MGRKPTMKGRPKRINGHDRYVHQWWVRSETDPTKEYKVSIDENGNYLCSCPAFKFRRGPIASKKPCKHILAVQKMLRERKEASRKAWVTIKARA